MTDPCDDWAIALLRAENRARCIISFGIHDRDRARAAIARIAPHLLELKRTDPGDPCDEPRRRA